jgi:hypothetical protein
VPLAKLSLASAGTAASAPTHAGMEMGASGHAAMIGSEVPAPGGPNDLAALLYPPEPLAHQPGRVREYTLVAEDRQLEVAKDVFSASTTPSTRSRCGDRRRSESIWPT